MVPSATVAHGSTPAADSGKGFAESVCVPFLLGARNADGGWPYRPGAASAVEPTAWCLLALGKFDPGSEVLAAGGRWLVNAQNADGSWPQRPGTPPGSWVTAVAGLALVALGGPEAAIANAGRRLVRSDTAEAGWRIRLGRLLLRSKRVVEQDSSLRGWSWTPQTTSWVEPTAASLIFLHHLPAVMAPAEAATRRRMGEALLYDRMCPAGGWNLGNPKVYGVEGIPQTGPTAWALLALQEHADREGNRRSLAWLEANAGAMKGPSSLALAHLALEACGRRRESLERELSLQFGAHRFLDNVLGYAQAAFALRPGPDVFRWSPQR